MIYLDNAATTQLDKEALDAMMPFLKEEYGNASQPYSFARKPRKAIAEARETIASCIGASPEEIYFTSGGTESDNWIVKGYMTSFDCGSVITSQIEHHALLNSCAALERMGYSVSYLPVDSSGTVLTASLKENTSIPVRLISVMFSNNEVGTIQPIKELSETAHRTGAIFHTDAVQAVGHVAIDVNELGIDSMSASAHKFNGPKGVGFLYKKAGIALTPFEDGGSQESGLRAGTENVAAIVGMAKALELNCNHLKKNEKHLLALEKDLISRLSNCRFDFIRNGSENHIPGNVSLSFANTNGELLLHRLDLMGLCVSTGSACNSGKDEVSHVLSAMRVPQEYIRGTIRVSFGKKNTLNDVKALVDALTKILL